MTQQEVTTTANDGTNVPDAGLVSSSLLSVAKDVRYIQQCQQLIVECLENVAPRSLDVRGTAWFLVYLLYNCIVVMPSKRTLGMAALGLDFSERSNVAKLCLAGVGGAMLLSSRGAMLSSSNSGSMDSGNVEALRGDDRRRQFQRLRRQMMQRSNAAATTLQNVTARATDSSVSATAKRCESPSDQASSQPMMLTRMKGLGKLILSTLMDALVPQSTPHGVRDLGDTDAASGATISIARWLIRLQLAHFCITGRHPTWLHRLCGLRIQSNANSSSRQASPIPRVVGSLICLQAMSSSIRFMINGMSRWMVRKYLDVTEPATDGIKDDCDDTAAQQKPQQSSVDVSIQDPKDGQVASCTICRMPRKHAAAPVSCGHVMCWYCLLHWVTNVRPECPICRSPCKPQEVLALHNYQPESTTDAD